MQSKLESRKVLREKGKALGIRENLVWYNQWTPKPNANFDADDAYGEAVAEAVEAILGAVWVDSGKSIETVKEVIKKAALDRIRDRAETTQDRQRKESEPERRSTAREPQPSTKIKTHTLPKEKPWRNGSALVFG